MKKSFKELLVIQCITPATQTPNPATPIQLKHDNQDKEGNRN